MRLLGFGKNKLRLALAVLVVSVSAALFVGQRFGAHSVDRLLRHDAEDVARNWASALLARPAELAAFVEGGGPRAEILPILRNAGVSERVFRYRLLDAKGRIVFSSAGTGKSAEAVPLSRAVLDGSMRSVLVRGAAAGGPKRYGEVAIPVLAGGALRAVVQVAVDQTRPAALLRRSQGRIAEITAILLLLSLLLPLFLVGLHYREGSRVGARVRRQASHDGLTGLPKRESFLDALQPALERAGAAGSAAAILYIDLDRFKEINDTLGHATGDALLEQFAQRLGANTREQDVLCRLSGDEFAVGLLSVERPDDVARFARRLSGILAGTYQAGGHEVVTSVSIGVAVAPGDGDDAGALLRRADLALCRAKEDGRRRVRAFAPEMEQALAERRAIEQDLRAAIVEEQFELHYQPILDIRSGREVAREALMRWRHPEKGLIAPNAFIQVAEETGQIAALSEWTLETACAAACDWRLPLSVTVNFSPAQFSSQNIPELVARALARSGLPAERLEIEITESVLLRRAKQVIEQLRALKALGVSIVMDDFGTGYSSLSYLTGFPFDKIKIDRSFIWEMESDPRKRSIVEMIVQLGRSLEVSITAEGIETPEQKAFLQKAGCVMVQGYLFSPPVADPEALKLQLDPASARAAA